MVIAQNAVKNTDVIIREMMLLGMEQTFVINVQRSTKRRSEMDINGLGHITTEEMKEEILNLRQSLVKAVHCQCKRCNHAVNDNPWPYWNWFIEKFGADVFYELKLKHRNNAVLSRADLVKLYEHYKNLDEEYLLLDRLAGVKPILRENNDE